MSTIETLSGFPVHDARIGATFPSGVVLIGPFEGTAGAARRIWWGYGISTGANRFRSVFAEVK
jgi:hypothetical protein